MAVRAVEMDWGCRPRGERCYRTEDGLTVGLQSRIQGNPPGNRRSHDIGHGEKPLKSFATAQHMKILYYPVVFYY
jgi:hypothetical protein